MKNILIIFLFLVPYSIGCVLEKIPKIYYPDKNTLFKIKKESLLRRKCVNPNDNNEMNLAVNEAAGPFNVSNYKGESKWNFIYQGDDWPSSFPQCGGQMQSPIRIVRKETKPGYFPRMVFNNYENHHPMLTVYNDGQSVYIRGPWGVDGKGTPTMSGGPLKGTYKFLNVHFHWSYNHDECRGSEHAIDNYFGAAEMHFVHFNTKYQNATEAIEADDPESLAVIGIMLKVAQNTSPALKPLFNVLEQSVNGDAIYPPIVPLDIVQQDGYYYTYQGSLTTPKCSEKVRWILMNNVLAVSSKTLNILRKFMVNGKPIEGNFRNVQPLNKRKVYWATVF